MPESTVSGRSGPAARRRSVPHSVNQLLTRGGALRRLQRSRPDPLQWEAWLREHLPAELSVHLSAVVRRELPAVRGAQLVLFADSASWCARLRYALGALESAIRERDAAIGRIQVRVRMSTPDSPPGSTPD